MRLSLSFLLIQIPRSIFLALHCHDRRLYGSSSYREEEEDENDDDGGDGDECARLCEC